MPKALKTIEDVLRTCHDQNGRRRTYYSELRYLRDSLTDMSTLQRQTLDHAIAETKSFVLNDAYYDEFEGFTAARVKGRSLSLNISASRDISKVWMPEEADGQDVPPNEEPEPLISTAFIPVESLQLSDILLCHTAPHAESTAFRNSVKKLYELGVMSGAAHDHATLSSAVSDHVAIMRMCLERVLSDRKKPDPMKDSVAQVYYGRDPSVVTAVASSCISAAAYFAGGVPGMVSFLLTPFIAFLMRKKAVSYEWKTFEVALAKHIESSVVSEEL